MRECGANAWELGQQSRESTMLNRLMAVRGSGHCHG